jgi:hypothetical protein
MIFEIGKFYRHKAGGDMAILRPVKTTLWGECLLAECAGKRGHLLQAVGQDKTSAQNWDEITREEWMKNFS